MSEGQPSLGALVRVVIATCVAIGLCAAGSTARAQNGFLNQQAVGGVSIDASGALANASMEDLSQDRKLISGRATPVPGELQGKTELRKISLRRLEAAIRACQASGKPLPDEILYLAGLQQIRYVLAYPEQNDIVLAGPGEGWKVDAKGNVVGLSTGRPVLFLDDLLVALRAVGTTNRTVMSCSIDPTKEGLQRVSQFAGSIRPGVNPQAVSAEIERLLGPQRVTITGVPPTSHFARVMVAADYRMKRISMGLEQAPVANFPSFLQMTKDGAAGMKSMTPRWWLAPNYRAPARDADGLTWQLRGASVKCLTETDFIDASGAKRTTGTSDVVYQRWADTMTNRYEDLAAADAIFGQLRNCMDLAVVAVLIVQENLARKAQADVSLLATDGALEIARLNAPAQIASQSILVSKGRRPMIAAGGVQINPWAMVEHPETSPSLGDVRVAAKPADPAQWWWN